MKFMSMIKKVILTIIALIMILVSILDIQPEALKYILAIVLLVGVWIPEKTTK